MLLGASLAPSRASRSSSLIIAVFFLIIEAAEYPNLYPNYLYPNYSYNNIMSNKNADSGDRLPSDEETVAYLLGAHTVVPAGGSPAELPAGETREPAAGASFCGMSLVALSSESRGDMGSVTGNREMGTETLAWEAGSVVAGLIETDEEAERKAKEDEAAKAAQQKAINEEAERKAKEDEAAKAAQQKAINEEAERKAKEDEAAKAAQQKAINEEAERKAKEDEAAKAAQQKAINEEVERKAKEDEAAKAAQPKAINEEAERKAKEDEAAAKAAQQKAINEEAERKAEEDEAAKAAQQKAINEEAERKAKEEEAAEAAQRAKRRETVEENLRDLRRRHHLARAEVDRLSAKIHDMEAALLE